MDRLGSGQHLAAKWQDDAHLTLHNTEVGALQDLPEAWPKIADPEGFTYAHLGGFAADSKSNTASRAAEKFIEWLGKQTSYSPQPYEQLASTLRKAGYEDKANDILYAGRQRERREETAWLRWTWSFLQEIVIGSGYRIYRAFFWIIGFVLLGAWVFRRTDEAQREGMSHGYAYSFDMLLPLVKLRERHYDIDLAGWPRYYFYVHKLVGYILASFLIAGLSGLTK